MPNTLRMTDEPAVVAGATTRPPTGGSLLIAMDGTWLSLSALRAGASLSRRCGLDPRIITVIEPSVIAPLPQAPAVLAHTWPLDADRASRVRAIRTQVHEGVTDGREWPVDVEVGNSSEAIAWAAMRDHVDLIAMGLRAHRRWDRLTGRETVLQVLKRVDSAVLAVTPDFETLPRRVLVAMDFSRSSIRAARATLRMIEPGATIVLAYVRPPGDFHSEVAEGTGVVMQQGIAASFARVVRVLGAPAGVEIRPVILDGRPADALLQAATELGADLIAAGRHRREFVERLVIGSVTTRLIRAAQCSVLITPPGPRS